MLYNLYIKYIKSFSSIFTCLPNLKAISLVIESKQGIINFINSNHLIIECSTTDESDSLRLSKLIESKSANYLEAPLTGGEWRSKNGNISVLVSGKKKSYNRALPILKEIGYEIVYLGKNIGNASTVKVLTNLYEQFRILTVYSIDQ